MICPRALAFLTLAVTMAMEELREAREKPGLHPGAYTLSVFQTLVMTAVWMRLTLRGTICRALVTAQRASGRVNTWRPQ